MERSQISLPKSIRPGNVVPEEILKIVVENCSKEDFYCLGCLEEGLIDPLPLTAGKGQDHIDIKIMTCDHYGRKFRKIQWVEEKENWLSTRGMKTIFKERKPNTPVCKACSYTEETRTPVTAWICPSCGADSHIPRHHKCCSDCGFEETSKAPRHRWI